MRTDSIFSTRRCLRILITIITTLSMLFSAAGCTGNPSEDDYSFLEQYEAPENLEHVSLKFLFPGSEPKNWPKVKAEIEKQTKNKLNVSLDFKWLEIMQYKETVNVLNASGEDYDAFITGKPDGNYPDFTSLARAGRLKDITELFPSAAPFLYNMYSSEELKYATIDDKLYAVPSLEIIALCTYLMADDEVLKKYSISELSTYNDYGEYLKTIKENEPDLIPGTILTWVNTLSLFAGVSGYAVADSANRLVYKWDDPDMTLMPWEKTPEFYDMISHIIEWYKKGYLVYGPDQSKTASFLFEGVLSPLSDEPQTMIHVDQNGQVRESRPMRKFCLYPASYAQRENPMGTFYSNGSFVFPAASRNTDRVLRFLEWVQQSRDNYLLMTCGIENEDYVLTSGYPTTPPGKDFMGSTFMSWDGSWAFNNSRYEFSGMVTEDGKVIENPLDFIEKYSKYPPHGPFYPNYGTLQQTAIGRQNAYTEFEADLTKGRIQDMAEVDKFIKNLDSLGTAELVEEAQRQISAAK